MKKIYYRPEQQDAEILSPSQWRRLVKVWGTENKPYNHMEELEFDDSFNTALPMVIDVLATIQNDRRLNERENELMERIKKGCKESKPTYRGGSKTVEAGMLCKLVNDAVDLFNKEFEEKINLYKFPMKEMYRIYSIPFTSIMDNVKKDEEKIGKIEKPKIIHNVKYQFPVSKEGDQQSTYKYYYIKGKLGLPYCLSYCTEKAAIYKMFPFLGKLHQSRFGKYEYFQLYVYDYEKRDWAMQTVINYLVKNKMVTLE
jgi:hypothetical protein